MKQTLLLIALLFSTQVFAVDTTLVVITRTGWVLTPGGQSYGSEAKCIAAVPTPPSGEYNCTKTTKIVAKVVNPPPTTVTWTECARETLPTCTFTGRREVRYGGKVAGQQMVTKVGESPVTCLDGSFGITVATNYENFCWYSSATTTAPITIIGTTPPPAVDVCPNIAGDQATIPAGMVKDAAGNCVTAPVTPPPTGTAPGPRVTTFTPSGPITATAGQVIAGLRISNPNGVCITISGVANVIVRDNEIGPCGAAAMNVVNGATGAVIEHNRVSADIDKGVIVVNAPGNTVQRNTFAGVRQGGTINRHAIEITRSDRSKVIGNTFTGWWESDILSGYESSNSDFTGNEFVNVTIKEPSGASFTIGDSTTGNPGHDNYIARNMVRSQNGGVPAGVFGSTGNTLLEKNCFAAGIQAYNYSGIFVGVTVRNNVINIGNSFVPDPSVVAGWSTNIDSTDCSKVPQ